MNKRTYKKREVHLQSCLFRPDCQSQNTDDTFASKSVTSPSQKSGR